MQRLSQGLILFISLILCAQPVLAGAPSMAPQDDESRIEYTSGNGAKSQCPAFKSVVMTVVYCVQISVVTATLMFLMPVTDLMVPITSITLILVVLLFGYVLLTGEQELNRKTFALLIKIGAVMLFGYDFGGYTIATFGASVSLQEAVVTTLWNDPNCPVSAFTAGAPSYDYIAAGGASVWGSMDCIIGKLFGFGGPFIMATSIFGILGSLLGSGTMGIMVFFFGLTTLLTIFMFALRAVYAFLICYIFIGFLIIISPMVIPMILFQATQNFFDAWLKNLMVAILTPGVIFAYLCMVLPLLDQIVTGNDPNDNYSLQQVLSDEDLLNSYRNVQQRCSMTTQNTDFSWFREVAGNANIEQWVQGPFRNVLVPTNSAATDGCQLAQITSADFGNQHVFRLWQIAFSLLRIFLVATLISMMMNMIPELVIGWVQGGRAAVQASGLPLPGQQLATGQMQRVRQTMTNRASGAGGGAGSLVGRRTR